MDWTVFHALNGALRGDAPAQDAARIFNSWAIAVLVVSTVVVWFLARPGGSLRSKLAAASALAAGGLGLLANLALSHAWYHARPFVGHPSQTVLLVRHGADNSFPSDHATLAFSLAFAVLAFHRRLGAVFVAVAALIALDRVFVGVHYPVDVAASAAVGLASALAVTTAGRPYVTWLVRQVSRVSDPVVEGVGRRLGALRAR